MISYIIAYFLFFVKKMIPKNHFEVNVYIDQG